MQLKGNFDPGSELFILPAFISSPNLKIIAPIDLIVDTGSSRTTINDKDVIRLQINYNDLSPSRDKYYGVGGTDVTTYELQDCRLLFVEDNNDDDETQHFEDLEYVLVNQHKFKSENEMKMMLGFQSLLGLDVLKKFKIRFSNFTVFLDYI